MSDRLERGLNTLRAQVDSKVKSYFSSCVHCGICAEACMFYTETNDPRHTPIYKTQPLHKVWQEEYTFWGRLGKKLGLTRSLTEADLVIWKKLVNDGCSMCGQCSMVCPVGIDVAYIIRKVKRGI